MYVCTFFIIVGTDFILRNNTMTFNTNALRVDYVTIEIPATATVGTRFQATFPASTRENVIVISSFSRTDIIIAANGTYVDII